ARPAISSRLSPSRIWFPFTRGTLDHQGLGRPDTVASHTFTAVTASSELPYPPFELANRVIELPSDDLAGYIHYEMQGRNTREQLVGMLPRGYSLDGRSMLDFGCGAGRILRQFHDEAAGARFVGCDIDRESIEWMNAN